MGAGRLRSRFLVASGREREFGVVLSNPLGPSGPVLWVALPAVFRLLQPLPISPTEEGEVEVAHGEAANLFHDRAAIALALFEFVGKQDDFRDHRHGGGAKRVVADGA